MFTICLKFQLTNKSNRAKVAIAICKQSLRLVCPTTFSFTYSSAKAIESSVNETISYSIFKSLSKVLTFSGALSNSLSVKSDITIL